MNEEAKKLYEACLAEEKELQFDHFTNEDAYRLGELLIEEAKKYDGKLGFEIWLNGLQVWRFYPTGITADHQEWMRRKRNVVLLKQTSSMAFRRWLEMLGIKVSNYLLDPQDYCGDGGGFPIRVNGSAPMGEILCSGINGEAEHGTIVGAVKALIAEQKG